MAFEYNGEQHYSEKHFFNFTPSKFKKVKKNDEAKFNECKEKNIELIVIPHHETNTTTKLIDFIKTQLNNRNIIFNDIGQEALMKDFFINNSDLQTIRKEVEEKGGKLLSNEYKNSKTELRVECEKGHEWKINSTQLKLRWCPKCSGRAKGTIEEMKLIAQKRKGKCLSTTYKNNSTPLKWECAKGHIWQATPHSIKNGKTWCIKCLGKVKYTIRDMAALAKTKGGKCLSVKYVNNSTKLLWECAK